VKSDTYSDDEEDAGKLNQLNNAQLDAPSSDHEVPEDSGEYDSD